MIGIYRHQEDIESLAVRASGKQRRKMDRSIWKLKYCNEAGTLYRASKLQAEYRG